MSLNEVVDEYCAQLRRRQVEGALPNAKRTAEVMRLLVTTQRHPDANCLLEDVRTVGSKIQAAKPAELAIGNIVRRVLHIVREEQQQEVGESLPQPPPLEAGQKQQPGLLSQAFRGPGSLRNFNRAVSLSNLLDQGVEDDVYGESPVDAAPEVTPDAEAVARRKSKGVPQWKAKHNVIELINELIDELDNIETQIAQQAVEHIHANEVILTFGLSDTTLLFLREAHKKRQFQVVVAEGAPRFDGHDMALRLAEAGIQTTLIADAAIFTMMARANKVLVGATAVLANGGVIAPSGTHTVALAARRHSVPLVVLVGLHKLSPWFPHDPDVTFNDFCSPAGVVDFDVLAEAFAAGGNTPDALNVEVHNPASDYTPPHLINLLVTDTGGYTPAYVYRLLAEYYSREDYVLSKELLDMLIR